MSQSWFCRSIRGTSCGKHTSGIWRWWMIWFISSEARNQRRMMTNPRRKSGRDDMMWITVDLIHEGAITSDAIWRHRSGSTLAQVMPNGTKPLPGPSHYLDQCWLLISEVLWLSSESNLTGNVQPTILYNAFEKCTFKITAISPRCQWVDMWLWH